MKPTSGSAAQFDHGKLPTSFEVAHRETDVAGAGYGTFFGPEVGDEVLVFRFRGGKVSEGRLYPADQYAVDEFWS